MIDARDVQGISEAEDAANMARLTAHEWFLSRPPKIQEAIRAYPAWRRYRMRSTGQIVAGIYSYGEPKDEGAPVTVTVFILEQDNPSSLLNLMGLGDRRVFGISPDDLESLPFASPDFGRSPETPHE